MTARDFAGREILEGDKVLWASVSGRSPEFQYRYVIKADGNDVWTSKERSGQGGRVSKVSQNSKMYIIGD